MNRKIITGGIIVICTIGLVAAGIIKSAGTGGGKAFSVDTVKIQKGEISSYITSDGIIEEIEKAEVFFDTPLKVMSINVDVGQKVSKGQQLLELDLSALQSQLETLGINRNTQQISIKSKAMDAEVERAYNNLKAAERNYNNAKKTFEENRELYNANAISKSELDMSEKAFIEAESGMSGLKNARISYNAAVESRDNSRKTGEESLKATNIQITDLEKKLSAIEDSCKSPMNGVVTSLGVQEGAFTGSMQPAYKIIDPDKLQIRAKVKEYDIKNVVVGQKARITGESIDKNTELTGMVKSIAPVAVASMTSSGNETVVEVLVDVDGAGGVLKPGLNVTCEISTVNKKGVLLVPMEAIMPDKDDNNIVFVIDESKGTMMQRQVTVGLNSDMYVEIIEGLKEGELVAMDPKPAYKDGSRVRISEEK